MRTFAIFLVALAVMGGFEDLTKAIAAQGPRCEVLQ